MAKEELLISKNHVPQGGGVDLATILETRDDHGWQDNGRSKWIDWTNPEGTRQVTVTHFYSHEYKNPMKDIHVYVMNPVTESRIQLIRIQAVLDEETSEIYHNVYLDALEPDKSNWLLATCSYFASREGQLFPQSGLGMPTRSLKYEQLSNEEYAQLFNEQMTKEGFYTYSQLPKAIDINATILSVLEQLKIQDFSRPNLIPKSAV